MFNVVKDNNLQKSDSLLVAAKREKAALHGSYPLHPVYHRNPVSIQESNTSPMAADCLMVRASEQSFHSAAPPTF